jgi:serine/threonine protein kinase
VIALEPPLNAGATLGGDLVVLEHLSRNEVMDVYDVWDAGRYCRCVAKALRPDCERSRRDRNRLAREGELLAHFTHPHLVRAYETRRRGRLVVVLETLPGETLSHLLAQRRTRLPGAEVAILGLHVGSATRYLHRQGWLHLDLKPSNVIVDAGLAKLIDLSLVRPPGPQRAGVGTRPYLSPEQARGGDLGPAADVWGLGALLFETACGEPPFVSTDGDVYPQLRRRAPATRVLRRLAPELATLIDACLEPAPGDRPAIDACLDVLDRCT